MVTTYSNMLTHTCCIKKLPETSTRITDKSHHHLSMKLSKSQQSMAEVSRPLADFAPTKWQNPLVSFPDQVNQLEYEMCRKQNRALLKKARDMLMSSAGNAIENIKLIDILCRLGVSYHFRDEIEDQLIEIYDIHLQNITKDLDGYDLHTVALVFHTLRSHGFMMPCDVFERFKREDGKFDEAIAKDARGMLSLYDAAQWSIPGEEILDEAIAFVKPRLKTLATQSSSRLAKRIIEVLEWPYHKDMPRIQETRFISFYEEEEERNHILLEFAKLDFKLLQQLYRLELHNFSRWYHDLNLCSAVPYARSRTVEVYFWGTGSYFEPRYSHARLLFAKIGLLATILNDTYDAYGTFEELTSFTDAIQRWEVSDELPDYMKLLCRTFFNFYNEAETELTELHGTQCFVYAKNAFKQLAKAYYQKATWRHQEQIPTFEEIIKVGIASFGFHAIVSITAIGLGKDVDIDALQWLVHRPKLLEIVDTISRMLNDTTSHKFEQKRVHCPSSLECYMEQYGVKEEEATKRIEELVRHKWKEFNKDFLRPNHVSRPLIKSLLDILRTTDLFYKYDDAYTCPDNLNAYIKKLFVDDISI